MTEALKELKQPKSVRHTQTAPSAKRRKVAGRKRVTDQDATLLAGLDRPVDPATRGDPASPLAP